MDEPFSGPAFGAIAVTEGIKFLYAQAGEVLRRWRERRDANADHVRPATLSPPEGLLEGAVRQAAPRDDYLDRLQAEILAARRELADYAEDLEVPGPDDRAAIQQADALRRLLELVYGQPIVFRGEQRPRPGPLVIGEVEVARVAGDAAAVRAGSIDAGTTRGTAAAKVVEPGGRLTGVDADEITSQ